MLEIKIKWQKIQTWKDNDKCTIWVQVQNIDLNLNSSPTSQKMVKKKSMIIKNSEEFFAVFRNKKSKEIFASFQNTIRYDHNNLILLLLYVKDKNKNAMDPSNGP